MIESLDLHNIMQWLAFAGLAAGVWARVKNRDKDRDAQLEQRLRLEARIEFVEKRLDRHEKRDDRIFATLEKMEVGVADIDRRMAVLEQLVTR